MTALNGSLVAITLIEVNRLIWPLLCKRNCAACGGKVVVRSDAMFGLTVLQKHSFDQLRPPLVCKMPNEAPLEKPSL